jgi:hypothetical protein
MTPLLPVSLPGGAEITSIVKMQTPTLNNICFAPNPYMPVPIDISTGTYNMYTVTGTNLTSIVSASWYPLKQGLIIFKMVPWRTYLPSSTQATFGIIVQDQEGFDYQRGGNISFRTAEGYTMTVPAATYSSQPWLFSPTQTPLQGWDTGFQSGSGGAY